MSDSPTQSNDRVPDPPAARAAAIVGMVLLVAGVVGLVIRRDESFDGLIGLCILLAPVMGLVAVISRSRAKEQAEVRKLSPEEQTLRERAIRARPVVTTILIAGILVGGGLRSVTVVVGGLIVLIAWLAWLHRETPPGISD